jgi:hypothetical protein
MYRKFALAGAALAAAVSLTSTAFAGANDYTFEPVKGEVKKGDDVVVSVRLKHKATDKPVNRCGDIPDPDRHEPRRNG